VNLSFLGETRSKTKIVCLCAIYFTKFTAQSYSLSVYHLCELKRLLRKDKISCIDSAIELFQIANRRSASIFALFATLRVMPWLHVK